MHQIAAHERFRSGQTPNPYNYLLIEECQAAFQKCRLFRIIVGWGGDGTIGQFRRRPVFTPSPAC